jgi:hypothetical protein
MAQRPRTLSARWTRRREEGISYINGERGDVLYEWGDGCSKADGGLLHYHLGVGHWNLSEKRVDPSLLAQLHARGYDLTTLKFSIRKRPVPPQSGEQP